MRVCVDINIYIYIHINIDRVIDTEKERKKLTLKEINRRKLWKSQ